MPNKGGPIEIQVALQGKGLRDLSHELLQDLVLETVNGVKPPRGVRVEIIFWRSGVEIDWRGPHSEWARTIIRDHLQRGELALSVRRSRK